MLHSLFPKLFCHHVVVVFQQGFLCPMCMARLPGPAELQSHFERVHSEGGVASSDNVSFSTVCY